jgi:hypothetical protein
MRRAASLAATTMKDACLVMVNTAFKPDLYKSARLPGQ